MPTSKKMPDGSTVLADGQVIVVPPGDEQVAAWAAADPDMARGLAMTGQWRRGALVRAVRLQLKLTQQAFADRYGIPVSVIRDWELHRTKPSVTALSYLHVIAAEPERTAAAVRGAKVLEPAE